MAGTSLLFSNRNKPNGRKQAGNHLDITHHTRIIADLLIVATLADEMGKGASKLFFPLTCSYLASSCHRLSSNSTFQPSQKVSHQSNFMEG